MAKVISIGNQSFESMRERDNFYVDNNFNFDDVDLLLHNKIVKER